MVNRYLAVYRKIFSTSGGRQFWWISSLSTITLILLTRPWTTLRICTTVFRASSCVNRSSLWETTSIFFSTRSVPTSFSSFMSHVINSLIKDGLTKSSLFCLSGRQRECGEQLHKNLDNHPINGFCRKDLGVDLKAIKEASNRLEEIGHGTVVIYVALDRLIRLNVTEMRPMRVI